MRQRVFAGMLLLAGSVAFGQSDTESAVIIAGEGQQTEVTIDPEAIPDISKAHTVEEVENLLSPLAAVRFDFESHIKVPPNYEEVVKKSRELSGELRQLRISHEPTLRAQFAVARDGKLVQGFWTALFDSSAAVLLIFEDGQLLKAIEPLPRPSEVVWDPKLDAKVRRWLPIDADERLAKVLSAPGLTPAEFTASVKGRAERNIEARLRHSEPNPAILSALKTVNLEEQAERTEREYLDRVKLSDKFDIRELRLGSSIDELRDLFGDPIAVQEQEALVTHVYGARERGAPKIAVRLVEGRATSCLTGDFFDDRLLTPPTTKE
jgi:hypothetical protein